MGASFRFFSADAALAPFVEYFYCSDVPATFLGSVDAMRLPEAEGQIVFAIEEGTVFPGGQWLHAGKRACLFFQPGHLQMVSIPGTIRQAVGASLRPTGLRLLLPGGGGGLVDAPPRIALEDLWGPAARDLLGRLLAQPTLEAQCSVLRDCLLERARRLVAPSRTLVRAVNLIRQHHGELSTEQLAVACGCTSRSLRSWALAEVGLAPKHLARVARIRRALELLTRTGAPLSQTAVDAAFSDQAHMSREFRELIGRPPAALSERLRVSAPGFEAERDLASTGLLVIPRRSHD